MVHFFKNQKGMSLIEILIVLSIIAGAMAAILSTVFTGADKAKTDQAKAEIARLSGYVKLYKMDTGKYPTTEEGLEVVAEAGFMEEVLQDPWKQDYLYESPGTHGKKFEICSQGPDDEDESDDICNYKKDEDE